jgi:hypothetical protein
MRRFQLIITTHVKSLFQPYLRGGGGNIEILYHHFTRINHRHSFSSPSFRLFHYHLHAFTRKTHSAQKRLLDSLSVHFTERLAMGGPVIWHEPTMTALLELYPEVYQIFLQAGWLGYFQRLQGFDQQQVLQFARNLQEDHSIVQGVWIPVTEEDIAQVSGLPTNGIRWFSCKHIILNAHRISSCQGNKLNLKAGVSDLARCRLHGRKLQSLSSTTLPVKADTR